jgi:hypothetical protein
MRLPSVLLAGLAYFAIVFALGFVLGTARVLWIAPRVGEMAAVLLELPVMLWASWRAARILTRRYLIGGAPPALAMGALAFALLMAAEMLLARAAGSTVRDWLTGLARTPGTLGLAGQLAFAAMPLLARRAPTPAAG